MRFDSQKSKPSFFIMVVTISMGLFLHKASGEEQVSYSAICDEYCQADGALLQLIPLENNRQNVEVEMCYCNTEPTQAPRMVSVYVRYDPNVLSFSDVQPLDVLREIDVDLRYRIIQAQGKTYVRLMAMNMADDRRMGKGAWMSLRFDRLQQDTTQIQFSSESSHQSRAFAPAEAQAAMNDPQSWGSPALLMLPGKNEMIFELSFNAGDARDSSGNERHGRLWGGETIPGVFSNAIRFDGIRDRLVLPAWYYEESDYDRWTASFWFYSESRDGLTKVLVEHLDTAKIPRLMVKLEDNSTENLRLVYVKGSMGSTGETIFEAPELVAEISPLQWHQLAYQVDEHQVHFYLDGEYRASFEHGIMALPFCPARNLDTSGPIFGERDADEWVVFSSQGVGTADIMRMSTLGEFRSNLTDTENVDEREPAWNSLKEKIAFAAQDQSNRTDLYWMKLDGSQVQALTEGMARSGHPSWSPDGTKLVFHSEVDGNFDIFVLDENRLHLDSPTVLRASDLDNPDVNAEVRLTENNAEDRHPVFIDNKRILYESDALGNKRLFVYDFETKSSEPLFVSDTNDNTAEKRPEVYYRKESDGTTTIKILFERSTIDESENIQRNAYIYDCSTANSEDLLCSTATQPLPVFPLSNDSAGSQPYERTQFKWSADGQEVIFVSYENSLAEIYRVRADGSGEGLMRLSLGGAQDKSPQWIRQEREQVCHQVSGRGDTQGYYFAGGIDELRVWNYLRKPEMLRLDAMSGQEKILSADFVPPEPVARSCPHGLHSECPEYYLCQENVVTSGCGPEQPCPEGSQCLADPSTGQKRCVQRQCVMQRCQDQDDCELGTCIEHPGLREDFCRVDCSFDAQCYGTVCPLGGPCSVCQEGRCGECRTADDCPDNNAYYCDEPSSTCQSKCYAQVDGAWEYLCMDFEYCYLGRCTIYKFTSEHFQPATQKSLTSATQVDIVIEAAGLSDYLVAPRMVLEGESQSKWVELASWYVRNRPKVEQDGNLVYEKYKTGTRLEFEKLRIRMEPQAMDVVNSGSLREMGYLIDKFDQFVPLNAVGIAAGKQALFIKTISVGTMEFHSQQTADLTLSACKLDTASGYIDDAQFERVDDETVANYEFLPINCSHPNVFLEVGLPDWPDVSMQESNPGMFELSAPMHCDPLQEKSPYRLELLEIDSIVSF